MKLLRLFAIVFGILYCVPGWTAACDSGTVNDIRDFLQNNAGGSWPSNPYFVTYQSEGACYAFIRMATGTSGAYVSGCLSADNYRTYQWRGRESGLGFVGDEFYQNCGNPKCGKRRQDYTFGYLGFSMSACDCNIGMPSGYYDANGDTAGGDTRCPSYTPPAGTTGGTNGYGNGSCGIASCRISCPTGGSDTSGSYTLPGGTATYPYS